MGHKAAEATCNINNTFDPGIANECTVQWCFKKFCKGDECLEDEECSGWPLEVDNNKLRAIIETDPLTTIWEVAKELNVDHCMAVKHLKQIGKLKKLDKLYLMSWLEILKIVIFSVIFSHSGQQLWSISHIVICNEKRVLYKTSKDQLSGWTGKKLQNTSQSQTWTKKRSWSLFDSLLPSWSTIAFWIWVTQLAFSTFSLCCSVTQSCPTLCDPMDYTKPGLPVPHHLRKFAQVNIHCIDDATQLSHPLMLSSPSALNLSLHQGLFQRIGCSHQMTKMLELQL